MKVYIVNEILADWGTTTKVFDTKEKAQKYMREYLAEELLVRIQNNDKEGLVNFVKTIDVNYLNDENGKQTEVISTIWFSNEDYIDYSEAEVE